MPSARRRPIQQCTLTIPQTLKTLQVLHILLYCPALRGQLRNAFQHGTAVRVSEAGLHAWLGQLLQDPLGVEPEALMEPEGSLLGQRDGRTGP